MIEFPSWIVVVSQINLDSKVSLLQIFVKSIGSSIDLLLFSFEWDRHNNYLHICNSWRKHKTFIVSVIHCHDTDWSSGKTPRCLPYKFLFLFLILENNIKHFCEVLTQVVRGGSLYSSSIFRYPSLNSRCLISSWEFLRLSLYSFTHWNGEDFFVNSVIELQVVVHLSFSLLISSMSSVTFLPQKFTCSNEWSRVLELPSDDVSPLIEFKRKISMTLNPVCVGRIHNGLASGSNSDWFSKITWSWFSNPSNFRSKTLDMILFNF